MRRPSKRSRRQPDEPVASMTAVRRSTSMRLPREICERYEQVDGLFYDICFFEESCYCDECRAGMQAMGFCPDNEADAKRYFCGKAQLLYGEVPGASWRTHPNASVFFQRRRRKSTSRNTTRIRRHFELEDRPQRGAVMTSCRCAQNILEKPGSNIWA